MLSACCQPPMRMAPLITPSVRPRSAVEPFRRPLPKQPLGLERVVLRPGPQHPALTVEGWPLAPLRLSNVRRGEWLNLVLSSAKRCLLEVQLMVLVEAGLHVNRTTGATPRHRRSPSNTIERERESGREPKERRPDRGAGRGQTGPAASGYAVFVAPTLSRVPDGGSEGGAPTIRSARAVPGPAPQGVASQRPRAPGRQSPTSCASAARAAFDFAAQSPPTLSIRRYRGWPPQASSSQQALTRILEQIR